MEQSSQPTTHLPSETPAYCVFRQGDQWNALPAIAVREALVKPDIVFVPGTPDCFAGLCHVRSEFIPVLNVDTRDVPGLSHDQVLLILDDVDGAWGLLADEVSALRPLVVSDAPEADSFEESSVVVGWATLGDSVVQVLDPTRLRYTAEEALQQFQQTTEPVLADRH